MLNLRRGEYFKVDLREIIHAANLPKGAAPGLAAAIFAKGARQGIAEAKEYIAGKCTEGVIPAELRDRLSALLDEYSFWR